jgi:hypothetical protein
MAESDSVDLSTLHALLKRTRVRAAPIAKPLQNGETLDELYLRSPEFLRRRQEQLNAIARQAEQNAAGRRAEQQVAQIESFVHFITNCVNDLGYADIRGHPNLRLLRARSRDFIIMFRVAVDERWSMSTNILAYADFFRLSFVRFWVCLHLDMEVFSDDDGFSAAYTSEIRESLLGISDRLRRSREVLMLTDAELDAARADFFSRGY